MDLPTLDRGKAALARLIRGNLPTIDYLAQYAGKAVRQSGDLLAVDVVLDDLRFPREGLQNVPLRVPPGQQFQLDTSGGPRVLVTWEAGNPKWPRAQLWEPGAHVVKAVHNGDLVVLGGEQNAQKTLLAENLIADLKAAATALNTILNAGTVGGPTKQQIVQAAQWALTELYIRLEAGGAYYLSTAVKNQ